MAAVESLWQVLTSLFLITTFVADGASGKKTTVDVGVVLDINTPFGKMCLEGINMGVDEFYANSSRYATRLAIHARDSKNTTVGAASAALYLLEDVGVQAILGLQSSSQAVFVSDLAAEAQVPLVSFTATSPSLSAHSPFFVRTTLNDSAQVPAIASLFRKFPWREAAILYEDSDFGYGIVPQLTDALLVADTFVTHRSSFRATDNDSQVSDELTRLMAMRTRVFVVHMAQKLGSVLFREARKLGMMGSGYVWIMTTGITMELDSMDPEVLAGEAVVGVLGFRPYNHAREMFDGFSQSWRRRFGSNPNLFVLWAYDTVRALAEAAEDVDQSAGPGVWGSTGGNRSAGLLGLEVSRAGPRLLESISRTDFEGVSGWFRLVDRQLEGAGFELINVVRSGNKNVIRTVGYWTPTFGLSGSPDGKVKLKGIAWPGGPKKTPMGWEWPTMGRKLRIGVPLATGFLEFAEVKRESGSNETRADGFCIKVFEAAMKKLAYRVPYEYVLYADHNGTANGTYDDLVYQVYLNKFDAVVGDVTIWPNRSLYVDFTTPFTESGVVMLVPIKKYPERLWGFLDPMTNGLWAATAVAFVVTGAVVWLLEHRINEAFNGISQDPLGNVFYFSFLTMIFAHKEKVFSNLSRIVLVVWFFVVLILTSSYTASFSSMLTSQQLQPTVSDVNDLIDTGERVGYLGTSFIKSLLLGLGFNESNLIVFESPEGYDEALSNGSRNGGVAAIFDEIPYIRIFLSRYPSKYTVAGPTYRTGGFGFVFPRGSPLVAGVSRAILEVKEGDEMIKLEHDLYRDMANAPLSIFGDQATSTVQNSLSFTRFLGLFLITGTTSTVALLLHLAKIYWQNKQETTGHDTTESLTIWAKIILLFRRCHIRKEPTLEMTTRDLTIVSQNRGSSLPRINATPQSPSSFSCHTHQDTDMEDDQEPPCQEETFLRIPIR